MVSEGLYRLGNIQLSGEKLNTQDNYATYSRKVADAFRLLQCDLALADAGGKPVGVTKRRVEVPVRRRRGANLEGVHGGARRGRVPELRGQLRTLMFCDGPEPVLAFGRSRLAALAVADYAGLDGRVTSKSSA